MFVQRACGEFFFSLSLGAPLYTEGGYVHYATYMQPFLQPLPFCSVPATRGLFNGPYILSPLQVADDCSYIEIQLLCCTF